MGNICSKSANKDNFSTPGRPLGASSNTTTTTTNNNARAPVPQKVTTQNSPGRTLGSSNGTKGPEDARSAAAKAAEVCQGSSLRTQFLPSPLPSSRYHPAYTERDAKTGEKS